MEKISIIIPAYNVEKYIRRCLESILDQKYNIRLEIIVVDDGSTDKTASILQEYKSRYPQLFKIVSKKNGGVSSARNVGLDIADGDWITFIDSDDYIVQNGLSFVIDNFLTDDVDICKFSSTTLDPITMKTFKEPEIIKGDIIFKGSSILGFDRIRPTFVWTHIYRRQPIQDLRFKEIPMGEDVVFNLDVYMRDLRMIAINSDIYRYIVHEGQLTSRNRDKQLSRVIIKNAEETYDSAMNYRKMSDKIELKNAIDNMIATQFIPLMSRILTSDISRTEFAELMARLSKKGIFPVRELGKYQKAVNFIGKHPSLFPLEKFLFQKIFVPFVLPRLSRN